ncbi:ScbA/BarX family gamma-butyrolactone biosynthesis protein [Streptomyces sp. O3]
MATGTTDTLRTAPRPSTAEVNRGLVRKVVPAEALVIDWEMISDREQRVVVRWPADHSFYRLGGRYSPLLVTESIRQALALLTHTVHGIPLDHRLGWELLESTVDPRGLRVGDGAVEVELLVAHTSVSRRRLGSVHLCSRVVVLRDGRTIGGAKLNYTTHPPAIYDRLRGSYADAPAAFARALPVTEPVSAALVGRGDERDVVLSPTDADHTWRLRVDTGHSVLFDHPHDHVPGMALLEAVGQIAQAEADTPVVPIAFDTVFLRYVEFDQPVLLSAERMAPDPDGRPCVKVSAVQDLRLTFTCTVISEPDPAR